ncbi:MAG: hypothetical protein IVW51_02515 [Thermaceae bacterium]|nr:hypothetical protein [Thermaceae bacterium]
MIQLWLELRSEQILELFLGEGIDARQDPVHLLDAEISPLASCLCFFLPKPLLALGVRLYASHRFKNRDIP